MSAHKRMHAMSTPSLLPMKIIRSIFWRKRYCLSSWLIGTNDGSSLDKEGLKLYPSLADWLTRMGS